MVLGTSLCANSNVSKELLDQGIELATQNAGGELPPASLKNLEQGCSTTLVAALDPDMEDGAYLTDCNITEPKPWAKDDENVFKLWELSERLVGEKFEF